MNDRAIGTRLINVSRISNRDNGGMLPEVYKPFLKKQKV